VLEGIFGAASLKRAQRIGSYLLRPASSRAWSSRAVLMPHLGMIASRVAVMRDAGGTVEEWRSLRIGRPGPVEGVPNRRDRATALIEDIWCEKIHGCSCSSGTVYSVQHLFYSIRGNTILGWYSDPLG